jgi:acetyl-CoA carboxylase/biotin carboxylase 1
MEMYADETARGGVLETEGTLDVKFRKAQILLLAHRCDYILIQLDAELTTATKSSSSSSSSSIRPISAIKADIVARERLIFPLYHQGATMFADLHDTPGRMMAKSCISNIVEWKDARNYLYMRLKRRLLTDKLQKRIIQILNENEADDAVWKKSQDILNEWIQTASSSSSSSSSSILSSDRLVCEFLDNNVSLIDERISSLKTSSMSSRVSSLLDGVDSESLLSVLKSLTTQQKQALKEATKQL